MRLIAGLGNPGVEYAGTRHNIGFMVLDKLARTYNIPLAEKLQDALSGRGFIENIPVILVQPMNYMNRSGPPVCRISRDSEIRRQNILVIHDDMDLEFGRIKIKEKGGHGGHRGILSLTDALGEGDFSRLRMGIGRPAPETTVTDHVLGDFSPAEMLQLDSFIKLAMDAVVAILCKGARDSMNLFNRSILV